MYESSKKKRFFRASDATNRGRLKDSRYPFVAAEFTATVEVFNRFDCDNLMAILKWPLDWLVDRGVVEDDSPDHLWPTVFPSQRVKRKGGRSLFITLWPLKEKIKWDKT